MNALETRVLEMIGEDPSAPDVYVDTPEGMAPIRDSLNDAIQEIVMLNGSKKVRRFLPLRSGQMFYRIVTSDGYFGWVVDAWSYNREYRLEQTDLIRLSANNPRWMVTNAEPRSYFHVGQDVLGVWPKPSASSNILELQVVEIPAPYESDADRVNLRKDFEHAAVNYAVAEFWANHGDARQADDYFGRYLEALGIKDRFNNNRDRFSGFRSEKGPWPSETA